MYVYACYYVLVHMCVCVCACVSEASHLTLHKCVNICLNVPVCVCACECLPCPPACCCTSSWRGEFENLPPALTFQPPACQSCYVWYFSWRWGNGKQWPRLPGDAAVVTAEQQHGHFPQCHNATVLDSPQTPLRFLLSLPFLPSSLYPRVSSTVQRISSTFPHSPRRASASLSNRD